MGKENSDPPPQAAGGITVLTMLTMLAVLTVLMLLLSACGGGKTSFNPPRDDVPQPSPAIAQPSPVFILQPGENPRDDVPSAVPEPPAPGGGFPNPRIRTVPPPPIVFHSLTVAAAAPDSKNVASPAADVVPAAASLARQYIPLLALSLSVRGGATVTVGTVRLQAAEGITNPCLRGACETFSGDGISREVCLPAPKNRACANYIGYPYATAALVSLANVNRTYAAIYSVGASREGRMIPAIKISDNPHEDENEAVVLIVGNYHSREWLAHNVVYLLIEYLLANKNAPAIQWHLDNSEIWIVPMLNPDGIVYDQQGRTLIAAGPGRSWRKNRRNIGAGAFGVDLNRNHNFGWGGSVPIVQTMFSGARITVAEVGSSGNVHNELYRGDAAHSEPELKALCSLAYRIFPDVGVSYHTYGQLILYPWGHTAQPPPDIAALTAIAAEVTANIKAVHGADYSAEAGRSLYAVNGDFMDWMYGVFGAYAFTPELRPANFLSGGFYPNANQIQPTFEENVPGFMAFIRAAILRNRAITPRRTAAQDCS